jgi:hypothetical protein
MWEVDRHRMMVIPITLKTIDLCSVTVLKTHNQQQISKFDNSRKQFNPEGITSAKIKLKRPNTLIFLLCIPTSVCIAIHAESVLVGENKIEECM